MPSPSVAFILGFGPGVGSAVARKLASIGYLVAVASRSGSNTRTSEGYLSLKADFAAPDSIPGLFASVRDEFHAPPAVVVYNAAVGTTPPLKESLFSIPVEAVRSDLNVNTISPYVAAQQAVDGWASLPPQVKKTFIYTGNVLNVRVLPIPMMMTAGMGKSASAYWVSHADAVYAAQGMRFFYADERFEDGAAKARAIDADAHAEFYAQLAAHEGNVPALATFVKDKGYVNFKL
ncbi:hypothetical protein AYL99_08397 [Fonsecaea erecta]|uniref:Short-chain dehydrogenase n=1 Tax=Fonsecaea erecta TaxID=1367422 RepID=A0A178ZD13_9EURO|nr:hypothetical protein AYL99_08397 [Fonsecaea erecta]OAP57659.1 hypothetical protein AYL99_08397 [Fonsecaea erecta]